MLFLFKRDHFGKKKILRSLFFEIIDLNAIYVMFKASTAEFVLPRSNSNSRGRSKERSDFDGGMFGRSQSLPSPRAPYKHESTTPDLEPQRPRSSSVADEMQDNLKFFSRRRANKTKSAAEKVNERVFIIVSLRNFANYTCDSMLLCASRRENW